MNTVASSDSDHLFNEQMASDPATACIVRVGAPGRWHYEVIEGREYVPVCYVSQQDEARYCEEEECSLATASALEMIDSGSFANGGCAFEVGSSASPLLMLAAPSSDRSSSIASISEAAALLGLLVVPELMMRGSAADAAAARAASEHTALDAPSDRLSDVSDASDLSDGSLQSGTKESDLEVLRSHVERKKINVIETQEFHEKHQALFEANSDDKTLLEKSDDPVGSLVDVIDNFNGNGNVLGLPVGGVMETAVVGPRKLERRIQNGPVKQAKKIAEGAKKDYDLVEERRSRFQRKEAKKSRKNLAKRGVGSEDAALAATSGTVSLDGIDLGIDSVVGGSTKAQNDHVALWEEAMRLETAAEAAGFRLSKSDTPANRETYLEACGSAKLAWTTAAIAREAAANKSSNGRDKNHLLADVTTAEEKADDWGRSLKEARAKHNAIVLSASPRAAASAPVSRVATANKRGSKIKANQDVKVLANRLVEDVQAKGDEGKKIAEMRDLIKQLKASQATYQAKTATEKKANKQQEATIWQYAAHAASSASDYLTKAMKALRASRLEEAVAWEKAAQESQRSIDFSLNSIETRAARQEGGSGTFTQAAKGAACASKFLAKAIEAKAAGKTIEAATWEKAVEESQREVEYFLKAIEAAVAGKFEDQVSYMQAAEGAAWASKSLARLIELKFIEKEAMENAVERIQRSVEYYLKSIEARVAGNGQDAISYTQAAEGAACASKFLVRAIEAGARNNIALRLDVIAWKEAAEQSQRRVEYSLKAIEARAAGKAEDAAYFARAAEGARSASNYLVKPIEAKGSPTRSVLEDWKQAAEESQRSGEYYLKAIEARVAGNGQDAISYTQAAEGAVYAARFLERLIQHKLALKPRSIAESITIRVAKSYDARLIKWEKIREIEGVYSLKNRTMLFFEPYRMPFLEKALEERQRGVKYFLKAIEARVAGKAEDAVNFTQAAEGAVCASNFLDYLTHICGHCNVSTRTSRLRRIMSSALGYAEQRIEFFLKAIEARAAGKAEDAEIFDSAACIYKWNYRYSAKALVAKFARKLEEAAAMEKPAEQSQRSAEFFLKVIEARGAGKGEDAASFTNVANGYRWASHSLVFAIDDEEAGMREHAVAWRGVAEKYQEASHSYLASVEARAQGNHGVAEDCDKRGDQEFKETQELHQQLLTSLMQESQEQAITASREGKRAEHLEKAALNAGLAADRLAKALEARAAGEKEEEMRWSDSAANYQVAYYSYLEAERAYEARNKEKEKEYYEQSISSHDDGERYDKKAQAEREKASVNR